MPALRVNQLVVIAGPSGAGKTYLIDKIRKGDCSRLCEQLELETPSSWLYLTARQIEKEPAAVIDKLVLHYDLNANSKNGKRFANLDTLITNADSTSILTLCTTPEVLKQRNKFSLKSLLRLPPLSPTRIRRKFQKVFQRLELQKQNEDKTSTHRLYQSWHNYLENSVIDKHWLLDFNQPHIVPTAYIFDKETLQKLTGTGKHWTRREMI